MKMGEGPQAGTQEPQDTGEGEERDSALEPPEGAGRDLRGS